MDKKTKQNLIEEIEELRMTARNLRAESERLLRQARVLERTLDLKDKRG